MNGPDHYREAEKYLSWATDYPAGSEAMAECLRTAQVHAQLAMVALSVVTTFGTGSSQGADWRQATGMAPPSSPLGEHPQTPAAPAGEPNQPNQANQPTQEI